MKLFIIKFIYPYGGISINSQQRVLEIMKRLLLGEKLSKQQLMEEYDKSASVIQRDIGYITDVLSTGLDYPLTLLSTGLNKGRYFLDQPYLSNALNQLTYIEVFAIASILSASRAFENKEFHTLFDKVISFSTNKKQLKTYFGNELLEYHGVPDKTVLNKVESVLNAIENKQGIEFTYTKNNQTLVYQRTPFHVFFSDLYFFVATDNHISEDDIDLEQLNKFRINNIQDLKLIPKNKTLDYHSRFKSGEFRKSTWIPFYGKEMTLILDFYYDPIYVLDRFPNSKIIMKKENSVRISIKVNDGWGIKMWLLNEGPMVKVVSPKHMVDFMIGNLKETLSRYE